MEGVDSKDLSHCLLLPDHTTPARKGEKGNLTKLGYNSVRHIR